MLDLDALTERTTRGPWDIADAEYHAIVWGVEVEADPTDESGQTPMQVQVEVAHVGTRANAELIAALPELVDELQQRRRGRWITTSEQLAEHETLDTVIDCADGHRRIFGPYMLWYRVEDGEKVTRVGVNGYSVPMPCSVVPRAEL